MGTRNLTVVAKNGEYKIAQYGQWDGYPDGAGISILKFLKKNNLKNLSEKIDEVKFLSKNEIDAINEEIKEKQKSDAAFRWTDYWPHLSRDCGWQILEYVSHHGIKEVINKLQFAGDSLFCEWAYVIDLDENTFEVYKGFNEVPLSVEDRFYFLQENESKYYPVKLIKKYDLNNLPDEKKFLTDFSSEE